MTSLATAAGLAACGGLQAQLPATPTPPALLPTATAPLPVRASTSASEQPAMMPTIPDDPSPTAVPARAPAPTATPVPVPSSSPAPAAAATTPADPKVYLPLVTKGAPAVSTTFFAVGPGSSDVIPHQIVRTADDRLYIFVSVQYSTALHVYWTTAAGLPNAGSAFAGSAQLVLPAEPISVDAVYDGGYMVHVLVNLNGTGALYDYPFDTSVKAFQTGVSLATNAGTVTGDYIGSSGVSGMVDKAGTLQVVYWSSSNYIYHKAYTYTGRVLTQLGTTTRVDLSGSADHPALAVSPVDNSLTVAWVSQATAPASILVRSRSSAGVWDAAETQVSSAPVWTSTSSGINIDQGPSLLIGPDGTRHLTYIENYDGTGSYGRVHYVTNPGSGWIDTALSSYSHDPALALNSAGVLYIIGHGHPKSTTNDSNCKTTNNMCTIKRNSDGSWGAQQLFAAAVPPNSFDGSPSVKWSVAGNYRPEAIEFVFFSVATDYSHPTAYYGRF